MAQTRYKVFGWYGRGNCGDDAFVNAFNAILGSGTFEVQSAASLNRLESVTVNEGQELILGGGDVIKPFYLDKIPHSVDFHVLGCGAGYQTELNQLEQRSVKTLRLRNKEDVDYLNSRNITASYMPDLCFAIDTSVHPDGSVLRSPRKKLGVVLSAHSSPGVEQQKMGEAAYFEFIQWELAGILDELVDYYDIFWISFSCDVDAWDEGVAYQVRRKMQKRNAQYFINYKSDTPMDTLGYVSSMDLVITMKFHGAIFATMAGTPFVAFGQTRKMREFCRQEELEDICIPPFSLEKARFLKTVKVAEDPSMRSRLLGIASKNKEAVLTGTAGYRPAAVG